MVSFPLVALLVVTTPAGAQVIAAAPSGQYALPALPAPAAPPVATSLRSLVALLEGVTATSMQARSAKPRAITAVNTLLSVAGSVSVQASMAYRAQLAKTVRLVEQALTSADQASLDRTIQALADDLEIKVEHSRMSGGRLGGAVAVHVRTLRAAEELADVEVFCLSALSEAGGIPPDRLSRVDGVSKTVLVPGRYLIWVGDPAADATGDPLPIKVGEGRRELHLDLLAPPSSAR